MLKRNIKIKKIFIGMLIIFCFMMQGIFTNFSHADGAKATIYNGDEKVEEFNDTVKALEKAIELGKDSSKKIKLALDDDLTISCTVIPKGCSLTISLNNYGIRSNISKLDGLFKISGSLTIANEASDKSEYKSYISGIDTEDNGGSFDVKSGGNLNLKYIRFFNCHSKKSGGTAYVEEGGKLSVDHCKFEGNNCELDGGAIYIKSKDKEASISNSEFTDASADGGSGGAVCFASGKLSLDNVECKNCKALNNGGALAVFSDNCRVNQFSAMSCSAKTGGGIYAEKNISFVRCINVNDNKEDNITLNKGAYIGDGGISYYSTNSNFNCNFNNCYKSKKIKTR